MYAPAFAEKKSVMVLDTAPGPSDRQAGEKVQIQQPIIQSLVELLGGESEAKALGITPAQTKGVFQIDGQRFYTLVLSTIPQTCEQFKRAKDFDPVSFELPREIGKELKRLNVQSHLGKGIGIKCVGGDSCDGSGRYLISIHRSRVATARWQVCP